MSAAALASIKNHFILNTDLSLDEATEIARQGLITAARAAARAGVPLRHLVSEAMAVAEGMWMYLLEI
jgi:hypothetical protein